MKTQRRWIFYATMPLIAYIVAYYISVESVNSGVYRTIDGRWPKPAVYAIGEDITIGKVRRYSMDSISHPLFYPINQLDRSLRQSYWLESTEWWKD